MVCDVAGVEEAVELTVDGAFRHLIGCCTTKLLSDLSSGHGPSFHEVYDHYVPVGFLQACVTVSGDGGWRWSMGIGSGACVSCVDALGLEDQQRERLPVIGFDRPLG